MGVLRGRAAVSALCSAWGRGVSTSATHRGGGASVWGVSSLASASGAPGRQGGVPAPASAPLLRRGFSAQIFVHRDTPDNNPSTPFSFSPATMVKVKEIMSHYPSNYKQSAVIPVLDIAQQENKGWLTLSAMNAVAELLEMAPMRVYEVATFYSMYNRQKVGQYHIHLCGTSPCRLRNADAIEKAIKDHLKIEYGEITPDGVFSMTEMECMGACVHAPMIAVADYTRGVEGFTYNYYEDLTPETTVALLDALRKGGTKSVKVGSQVTGPNARFNARAAGEKTNLTGPPLPPFCRDINVKAEDAAPKKDGAPAAPPKK